MLSRAALLVVVATCACGSREATPPGAGTGSATRPPTTPAPPPPLDLAGGWSDPECQAILGRNQSLLDGEGGNADQHIAAVRCGVDDLLADVHLCEQIVHVRVRAVGLRHDGDLAGDRITPADTVNLQMMAGSHDRQQHAVALGNIGGQVFGAEIRAARCATAHHYAGDFYQSAHIVT